MKKIWLIALMASTSICTSSYFIPQAVAQTSKQAAKTKAPAISKLLGPWQGLTRMQRYDEPLFTFTLKPQGAWTDLTFGEKHAKNAKYKYDSKTGILTLFSTKGSVLYKLVWHPAKDKEKERLVEQVKVEDLYKAMVCYRYQPKS